MTKVVEEFDLESYKRKWEKTYAVHYKNEKLTFGHISKVNTASIEVLYNIYGKKETIPNRLVYWRFPSRLYFADKSWYLLIKKITKSFHIGIDTDTHDLYKYDSLDCKWKPTDRENLLKLDIFSELKPNLQKTFETFGPLNDRFFLGKQRLYYLNKPIGMREGKTLLLATEDLVPDLEYLTKDIKCEIIY